ncbi:MAG: bifunctional aspartate kinase/homoserine dehydrogenase I [Chitinophagaceae bacterium]|nr:bifunctional aspartate kinase/homoserine dehydrogenase I [Chitinophagaceae bacterium]
MYVLKFGGSSVATADNIKKVISIIEQRHMNTKKLIVVSALGGITDMLLQCSLLAAEANEGYKELLNQVEQRHLDTARQLIPIQSQSSILSFIKMQCNEMEDIFNGIFLLKELSLRIKDKVMSYGELLSSKIIATALESITKVQWVDSTQLIKTNSQYGYAQVNFDATDTNIQKYFKENDTLLYVASGFIASDEKNINTTLGRGGSDYSAAIYASALHAKSMEIWTDVPVMMTPDPSVVPAAKTIASISYQEAMELSHFGAKVVYPPTIQPAMNKGIPINIKNSFAPKDAGTVIEKKPKNTGSTVSGISSINNISLISLEGSGMVGIPGFSKRLFETLAAQKINVILITQSSSEHSICVGIDAHNAKTAKAAIDELFAYEIATKKVEPLVVENNLAIIALVGDQMKNHTGISGRLFTALGKNGVNIRAISQGSSERNISAVINKADIKKAINVIHEAFFEIEYKEINLFIAGTGNVGKKLIAQIARQQNYLMEKLGLKLKVTGIAKSKCFLIDENGIDVNNWEKLVNNGLQDGIKIFAKKIIEKNLRNSVFADITASEEVADVYKGLLEKSISVVACNKIACSSAYSVYQKLKQTAREYNTNFLFETNVGASLPVIITLNDLLQSGDNIKKIQGVLSGTLNYVFNHYNGSLPFASVVKQAQDEGYTEPDPRLDLGGKDVMRKIMILAREAGYAIEMDDIVNNSFLPEECMNGSVDDFYRQMEKHEAHFKALYSDAKNAGCKLKFVAVFDEGKASVGLQHINEDHDFYHLYGKDNIVLYYTQRYTEQPLVIKGAGAGAEVTASGVFADILRAAKA